jgi:hypothetical protein
VFVAKLVLVAVIPVPSPGTSNVKVANAWPNKMNAADSLGVNEISKVLTLVVKVAPKGTRTAQSLQGGTPLSVTSSEVIEVTVGGSCTSEFTVTTEPAWLDVTNVKLASTPTAKANKNDGLLTGHLEGNWFMRGKTHAVDQARALENRTPGTHPNDLQFAETHALGYLRSPKRKPERSTAIGLGLRILAQNARGS